jgi:hypothetical protein
VSEFELFNLHLITRVDREKQAGKLISGLSCSASAAVVRALVGLEAADLYRCIKNLSKPFDAIKVRPKFISRQRNSITH